MDNAATSWPKRPAVLQAAWQFATECGATAGRGSYRSALRAEQHLWEARQRICELIGAGDARNIAFCSSGTHALNAGLFGVLRPGDHVIVTEMEHNSVLRPLDLLAKTRGIMVDYARSDSTGLASVAEAASLVRPKTRWLILGHASNVTGAVHELHRWGEFAKDANLNLMVDASQTLGYLPIDLRTVNVSMLAAAGHKGLGGLSGTGMLVASPEIQSDLQPLMTGGTGLRSESVDAMPQWPQVVEVGNHNLIGIVSMGAAANELLNESQQMPISWQTDWRHLMDRLVFGLRSIPKIQLVGYPAETLLGDSVDGKAAEDSPGKDNPLERIPLVSILVEGWEHHEIAMILDSHFNIEVRSGLHCAALVHRSVGSQQFGGTLRLSPGHTTTAEEIDAVLDALRQIIH